MRIPESELVLNPDGSVYHLHLKPEDIADTIIIVGDPGRVKKVSDHFDKIEVIKQNREYLTHTGYMNNKRLTVMSTGMGPDNIEILMNELDAIRNIDLETRTVKAKLHPLKIIRIGTCGGIHPSVSADSWVISRYAIGFDNVLQYYGYEGNDICRSIIQEFYNHTNWPNEKLPLYASQGSDALFDLLKGECIAGITATAPGFYAPQGRQLRGTSIIPDIDQKLSGFKHANYPLTNFEMETSALYGLGTVFGHECCTVCTVIANRIAKSFSADYNKSISKLITYVLNRLTA